MVMKMAHFFNFIQKINFVYVEFSEPLIDILEVSATKNHCLK